MRRLRIAEGIPKEKELGLAFRSGSHGKYVEAVRCVVKPMLCHVSVGCPDNALLFCKSDGILRRIGILSGFHFHKDEDVTVPSDDVHLAALDAISRSNDSIVQCTQVIDGLNLRASAERQQAIKK
jgi:hypothetical protein